MLARQFGQFGVAGAGLEELRPVGSGAVVFGGVDADQGRSVGVDGESAFEELEDMLGVVVAGVGRERGDAYAGTLDGGANLPGLVEDIVRADVGEMAAPEEGLGVGIIGVVAAAQLDSVVAVLLQLVEGLVQFPTRKHDGCATQFHSKLLYDGEREGRQETESPHPSLL